MTARPHRHRSFKVIDWGQPSQNGSPVAPHRSIRGAQSGSFWLIAALAIGAIAGWLIAIGFSMAAIWARSGRMVLIDEGQRVLLIAEVNIAPVLLAVRDANTRLDLIPEDSHAIYGSVSAAEPAGYRFVSTSSSSGQLTVDVGIASSRVTTVAVSVGNAEQAGLARLYLDCLREELMLDARPFPVASMTAPRPPSPENKRDRPEPMASYFLRIPDGGSDRGEE